jgi:hypothetical protein
MDKHKQQPTNQPTEHNYQRTQTSAGGLMERELVPLWNGVLLDDTSMEQLDRLHKKRGEDVSRKFL